MVDQRQRHSPGLKVSKKKKRKEKISLKVETENIWSLRSNSGYQHGFYIECDVYLCSLQGKFLGPRLKCVVFPDFLQHFELVHTRTLFKHLARWSDKFAQKLGRAAVVVVCRVHGVLVNTGEMSEKRKKQNHTRYSRR